MLEGGVDEAEAQQLLTRMTELRVEEARLFAEEQAALLEETLAQKQSTRKSVRESARPRGEDCA